MFKLSWCGLQIKFSPESTNQKNFLSVTTDICNTTPTTTATMIFRKIAFLLLQIIQFNHRNLKFCPITNNNDNIKNTPIYYKKTTQGMKRIFPGQTESTSNASKKQRPVSISRLISINNTIMNLIPSITF